MGIPGLVNDVIKAVTQRREADRVQAVGGIEDLLSESRFACFPAVAIPWKVGGSSCSSFGGGKATKMHSACRCAEIMRLTIIFVSCSTAGEIASNLVVCSSAPAR